MKKAVYPVITFEQFKEQATNNLAHDFENYSTKDLMAYLVENGFQKLNKEDLRPFVKQIYMEPVFVDVGDNHFWWFIGAGEALVCKKPENY